MSTQKKTHIRAGLVGVTGYTGMELARILAGHPHMRLTVATARAEAGQRLGQIYPFLERLPGADIQLVEPDPAAIAAACDVAFLAVPHGAAAEMGAALLTAGVRVVDLSADFRLNSAETYAQWYGAAHPCAHLLPEAVYGLPELNTPAIARASLIANPGCYPSASILALTPALQAGIIHSGDIIIDAKSGTTGAGRKAAVSSLYCEVADSFRAYNLGGKHRHTPEIEQELGKVTGTALTLSFNPHLVPMHRGILATIYTRLASDKSLEDIHAAYARHIADWPTPWVRLLPPGQLPETRFVRGTMFCDIALCVDVRTQRLILVSAIDNLCRGASGQAVANANLMFGLPVDAGLGQAPLLP